MFKGLVRQRLILSVCLLLALPLLAQKGGGQQSGAPRTTIQRQKEQPSKQPAQQPQQPGLRRQPSQQRGSAPAQPPAPPAIEGSGDYYNRHPGLQFICRQLGPDSVAVRNGATGNGLPGSYFASGRDERDAYRRLHSIPVPNMGVDSPNSTEAANLGTYRFVGCRDICREPTASGVPACGDVTADRRHFVIGYPTHAMDLHPWGQNAFFPNLDRSSNPPGAELNSPNVESYRDRNNIPGLSYARVLINQIEAPDWINSANVAIGPQMEVLTGDISSYHPTNYTRPFIDIPLTCEHQKWGHTCGQIAATGIYERTNPCYRPDEGAPNPRSRAGMPIEAERYFHYRTLLRHAAGHLKEWVANDRSLYTNVTDTGVRGRREIFINASHILNETVDWLFFSGGDVMLHDTDRFIPEIQEEEERRRNTELRDREIHIDSCPVPKGTLVDYRHETRKICIDPEVAASCLTKRPYYADPQYNTGPVRFETPCTAGPGYIHQDDGLYEVTPGQGVHFRLVAAGDHLEARGSPGISARGNSFYIAAKVAHHLVHAHFQTMRQEENLTPVNRMEGWPHSQGAVFEETLATLTEFLVLKHLCDQGYCRNFPWLTEQRSIRSVNSVDRVTEAVPQLNYILEGIPVGLNGVSLGLPMFNAFHAVHYLEGVGPGHWAIARMMAVLLSQAPMMEPPRMMTVGGVEGEFER